MGCKGYISQGHVILMEKNKPEFELFAIQFIHLVYMQNKFEILNFKGIVEIEKVAFGKRFKQSQCTFLYIVNIVIYFCMRDLHYCPVLLFFVNLNCIKRHPAQLKWVFCDN